MKYAIWFSILFTGMGLGVMGMDYYQRTNFEDISGVNWHSFTAAAADCEVAFQEQCKIFGGFAPLSQFR